LSTGAACPHVLNVIKNESAKVIVWSSPRKG
jgi:hypothetical protein